MTLELEQQGDLRQQDFWDDHGLNEQRIFRIECLVYGSDPNSFSRLARDSGWDKGVRRRCTEDFGIAYENWFGLLAGKAVISQ